MTADTRTLLKVTAIIEGTTGFILAVVPSLIVPILLKASLDDPIAVLFARLAGAALLIVAISCWVSRTSKQSAWMRFAMLGYNIFAICLLVYAALVAGLSGPGLWPTVILHVGLLIWCLMLIVQPDGHSFTRPKMGVVPGRKKHHPAGHEARAPHDDWKTSAQIVEMKDAWIKVQKTSK